MESPLSAYWLMMSNTSVLAPMSMPLLGSSRSRIFGLVRSPFPMTTFCWLPPERERMGRFLSATLMWISLICSSALLPSSLSSSRNPFTYFLILDREMFLRMLMVCTRPSLCLSSGTRANPRSICSEMEWISIFFPSSRISPVCSGLRPMMHSKTSVRPAPISPYIPRISPLFRLKST